jgi:hypothetical protein
MKSIADQMLKTKANPRLPNEVIQPLSKEGNPDVQRISSRLNVTNMELIEVQMDQENSSKLTILIEGPNAMAIM